jgi:hypothetical protein
MPPLVAQYPDAHCVHYYIHYFGRSYTYDAVKTWSIFVINCMYCLLLMATFLHLGCGQIHVGPSCYLMSKDLGSDCTNKPPKRLPILTFRPLSSQLHVPTRACSFDLEYFHYTLYYLLLMASVFKCHPDCPCSFTSQRGLTQHRSTCHIYGPVQAGQIARANTTFLLTEEPPNKRVRLGVDELQPEVRVVGLSRAYHSLTWIPRC